LVDETGSKNSTTASPIGFVKFDASTGVGTFTFDRQLRMFLSTTPLLTPALRLQISEAFCLLFKANSALQNPLKKDGLRVYQGAINDLLDRIVILCAPHSPSLCNSIKYHWPRHWGDIRRELGCSAAEKSLEKKLGEAQKRNFKFTTSNGKNNIEVGMYTICDTNVI
jgi:hypothetical protein